MAKNRRRGKKSEAVDKTVQFWASSLPEDELVGLAGAVRPADTPNALVRSLGQPPLPGQNRVSAAYFDAVYFKAAHFATALATANELIEADGDDDRAGTSDGDDSRP
jgi:predicted short-subunit dehydrogenase-like oxidoreductase (DUF2520 family)